MHHFRRRVLLNSFKLADLLILTFSFGVAAVIVQQSGSISFDAFLAMRIKIVNLALFLGLMLCWHSLFVSMGLYFSMRMSSRWTEIVEIIKATSLGTLIIFIAANLFNMIIITPVFLTVFWSVATTLIIVSRFTLRICLGKVRNNGRNLRNIVVVGTNERAIAFAMMLLNKPELGYELTGFIDSHWAESKNRSLLETYPLIHPENLNDFLKDNVVDEVLISLPVKEYAKQYTKIIDIAKEQGVIVRVLADYFFSQLANARVEYFEGSAILTLYTGAMGGTPLVLKRLMDISLSLILLIAFSPLFLLVTLAIKYTSPGPILFYQQRLGLNKRRFRLYKFRTMVKDAEQMQEKLEPLNEAEGPVFKIKNDPRITKIGHFLRITSIDELPQLVNVLKGEMSLVGPRPLPVRDYQGFDHHWFNRRFSVRPGMTCLWQIDGRNDIPFEKWIQLDLRYIDNWSLPLDIMILVRTIPAVILRKGAS